MRRSDIDEVLALHASLFEVKYPRAVIESFVSAPHLSLLLIHVANQTETLIGVSVSSRRWVSLCSKQRTAYLSTFGIRQSSQRRGLGSYLFRLTCRVLFQRFSIQDLSLHMLRSKRSTYEFYNAIGMTASAVVPRYYVLDDKHHDALFMVKQFTAADLEVPERRDVQVYPEIEAMLAEPQEVWLLAPWFCAA
jgi:ribosomal protein S18 acetylase RimI-like enzyme